MAMQEMTEMEARLASIEQKLDRLMAQVEPMSRLFAQLANMDANDLLSTAMGGGFGNANANGGK